MKTTFKILGLFALLTLAGFQMQAQDLAFNNLSNCTYTLKAEAAPPNCASSCTVTQQVAPGQTTILLGNCNGSILSRFKSLSLETPKGPVDVGIGCSPFPSVAEFFDCEDQKRTLTMISASEAILE